MSSLLLFLQVALEMYLHQLIIPKCTWPSLNIFAILRADGEEFDCHCGQTITTGWAQVSSNEYDGYCLEHETKEKASLYEFIKKKKQKRRLGGETLELWTGNITPA